MSLRKDVQFFWERLAFIPLFIAVLCSSAIAVYLLVKGTPPIGRLTSPNTWAGTASGLSVAAALLQTRVVSWHEEVLREFGDIEKYPYGPPSVITRTWMALGDRPILQAAFGLSEKVTIFWLLSFWAGITCAVSYWID